jgi:hypothetical protein
MESLAEQLRSARDSFVHFTQKYLKIELNGSWESLLQVSTAMQHHHTLYEKMAAAKQPDLEGFVNTTAAQAAAYISWVSAKTHQTQLAVTPEARLILVANGVNIPISDLMREEVVTGKPNTLLVIKHLDEITKKKPDSGPVDPGNLPAEVQKAASVAVQDVRAMLKQELDYSPGSLALVDQALQRLKAIAGVSPESKGNLVRASCEKYGGYISEVLVRHWGGKWSKVEAHGTIVNAIDMGSIYAVPALIVQAVLENRPLDMGGDTARSVVEFAAKIGQVDKAAASPGLLQDLDTTG